MAPLLAKRSKSGIIPLHRLWDPCTVVQGCEAASGSAAKTGRDQHIRSGKCHLNTTQTCAALEVPFAASEILIPNLY